MTVNHDVVAALPISGGASKTLVRNVLVARMPYVLADAEDSRNLVATDPSTAAVIVDLLLLGRVFHYDPTDTTTAHDGTSCLVSADGLRYKLAVGTDVFAYAVLDNTISTPPVSPTLGDAYLVAAGATGAWAGKSNFIAVKTNRGWEFVNFSIGRFIYVESVDTYYHKNAGGSWVTGFGNQTTAPNSVPLSAAINFGKRLIVENQTTTAPPGSPTVGTAYIIGPSATGGWAGLDGKIAICEVAGSFVIYTPTNGWSAYDKAQNNSFTFTGSAWILSAGAIVGKKSTGITTAACNNRTGASFYSYNDSVAPTRSGISGNYDTVTLTYSTKRAGGAGDNNLRFSYNARYSIANSTTTGVKDVTIALWRDAENTALDWMAVGQQVAGSATEFHFVSCEFEIPANDALSHTYTIGILDVNANTTVQTINRRKFSLLEFA